MNTIRAGAVVAAAALAATLAACGSTASTSAQPALGSPDPAATAKPANPVPVLRKTGVPVPASEVNGTVGIVGDRVGHGTFPGGEEVWVFTYATPADMAAAIQEHTPSDGETGIQGPGLTLIDVDTGYNGTYEVPPAVIAKRVGGKVTGP